MEVTINLEQNEVHITANRKTIIKNFNIFTSYYNKRASILFETEHSEWILSWNIWLVNNEQFVSLEKHTKNPKDCWKIVAKWAYVSKPQNGTAQTNNIYRMTYKPDFFQEVKDITINITHSIYGDWDTQKFIEGYYY